jgi:hypothetical protein
MPGDGGNMVVPALAWACSVPGSAPPSVLTARPPGRLQSLVSNPCQAEAVDLIVPLEPDLIPIVQCEPLDLTHKVFERVRTKNREFWLTQAPHASKVGRHKR